MKTKRILSALLVLTVTLALLPNVVFAGDDYNIINGTPENDAEKNHGYITIDKTTAAENDTVTVTVNPADGYQLKSLVATPVASTEYTVTFDLNGITGTAPEAQTITSGEKVTKPTDPTDMIHTFAGWYKTKDATTGALSDPWDFDTDTVTADMTLYAKWTRTLESIYANSDIPKATNNTAPDDAWENGDGGKAFIAHSTGNAVLYLYKQLEPSGAKQLSCRKTEYFTKIGDDYVLDYYLSSSFYGKYTLHMTDGKFTSVTYNGAGTDYEVLSGTYTAPTVQSLKSTSKLLKTSAPAVPEPIKPEKQTNGTYQFTMPAYAVTVTAEFEEKAITIDDILPDNFPTCVDVLPPNLWVNGNEVNMMVIPYSLVIFTLDGDGNPDYVELANDIRTATLTKNGNNYTYTNNGVTTTFLMSDNGLESVQIEGLTGEYVDFNGTYGKQHTHSFTYTANNGKLTATCTAGCDKGYDTTPLTLTLTAPASLVYDGNGKAFTFADGEADAWTGAGLELPTIYYYEKKDYPFYMGIDSAPTDAGGDYMVEITVNKKAARIYFTIDKALPYIKKVPAPTEITYGQTLNDSTLFGGCAQISSTDSTQIGGWFEWTNGDTKPAVSDSETTEYDVTFTPSSDYEANFTTVTCKVKLKVNRAKTAVEPTVATGLVYDGTEQNGYTNEGSFVTFAGTKVAKSAGDYSFTATPDANYAWSDGTADTKTYNWEIAQKTATVKAVDASVRTGSTAPEFKVEFTDLLDADKGAVTEGFDPIFAVMTTGDMPVEIPVEYALKTAGDYTIVITNAEELDAFANYSFIAYTGKFTVIKRSSSSPAGGSVSAEPISYTVSFETDGAGTINSASIEKNATVSEPSAPTKEGYRFIGWYTDKACTNKYNFANKVTKSMTLYAGWDQITSDDNMKDMIMLTIGNTEALAWGEVKNNDVAPIIRNDRTMLPARFVAENLGATVSWDADERKVTITKEGTEILIYIDSDIAYVNGEEVKLDSPAFIENDRTYTPVRFIAESLGAAVEWIEENQQVVITK